MKTVILTDGGMGQELVRRAGREPTPLWSTTVLMEQPELVRDLHADFIRAGAKVITINTYSATPERLESHGLGDSFGKLQDRGYDLAAQAREICAVDGISIAACLPPLVASYRPDIAPVYEESLALYRRIAEAQAEKCDLILCETLASVDEVRAAATAARETGKPVWVAMTVRDDGSGLLRSGETLAQAHAALDEIGVDARLLNCSRPESIAGAWNEFSKAGGLLGAYANGFTGVEALIPGSTVSVLEARRDLDPQAYADFALGWADAGAGIVGGCCEVGPTHIAELNRRLAAAGYQVTGLNHG